MGIHGRHLQKETAHAAASQEWPSELAGMLPGGGMSCQLAVCGEGGIDDPDCISLNNGMLALGGIAELAAAMLTATELDEGLRSMEEVMVDCMANIKGSPGNEHEGNNQALGCIMCIASL